MSNIWRWPIDLVHHVSATAGGLTFVGGAGDFDDEGAIRSPGDLDRQIAGAVANIAEALGAESCGLGDVVRLKVFYAVEIDDWEIIAKLAAQFPDDPMPAISTVPEPLQPFDGQVVQIQAVACRHWRQGSDIRVATRPVPPSWQAGFAG
jgi:enamine deaminase RidA (YjgF/YER057c/UK114 family)